MATVRALSLFSPIASAGAKEHADWLELKALLAADGDASFQDLVAELRRAGTLDGLSEGAALDERAEKSHALAEDAFAELDLRATMTGAGYPFSIDGQTVKRSKSIDFTSPYLFLLLLRRFGVSAGPRGVKGAGHFEELAEVASRHYLGGEAAGVRSYHFGFPRRTTQAGFEAALDDLCQMLGEGGGSRSRPSRRNQKDAKLDIVAWRPFLDGRTTKIIAFGQCAAGDNWDGKASELVPQQFMGMWLKAVRFAFNPVVFFFVPHTLDDEEWDSISMIGTTIPFDRCRIAGLLSASGLPGELSVRTARWSRYVLNRVSA